MSTTPKTLQAEARTVSKQRGFSFWISCFALLIGLGILAYSAYCWGLWGRGSLLLQYLFQCSCPAASEEARYPERVDVIVSACHNIGAQLSPSGKLLYVYVDGLSRTSDYLLDLQTGEKITFFLPEGSNHFLTDDSLFLSLEYGYGYEGGEYILDRTTGKQYPIRDFLYWRSDAYINGETNLSVLVEALRMAEDVFLIDDDTVVALSQDFQTYPDRNFFIHRAAFPGRETNRAEQFLQQNNIVYHYVPDSFPSEALSPDKRFIARDDGIYLVNTSQKIVEGYSARGWFHPYSGKDFSVRGWTYDGTGAIYSKFLNPCLIEASFFLSDEPGCFFDVPQPVIKLKVPEQYLLSAQTP